MKKIFHIYIYNCSQNGRQTTPSTDEERKLGRRTNFHTSWRNSRQPLSSPRRFRPTTEFRNFTRLRCSIDKLFRACCTRAGACAFQRGALQVHTTTPPQANTFLVYFPMISPQSSLTFATPSLSLFLFCFVSAGGYNNPNSKGRGLSTEKSAWKHSNYPFETNVSRVIRLATPLAFDFLVITCCSVCLVKLFLLAIVVPA